MWPRERSLPGTRAGAVEAPADSGGDLARGVAGEAAQIGEAADGDAGGGAGDADAGADGAGVVEDGRADAADRLLVLDVVGGVAAVAHGGEVLQQLAP